MGLLVEGFKNAGSTDKVALKNALAATNGYPGVTGTISYTRPSRVPVKPVAIMSVQNAKFKVEEIWMPKVD
jgi:branched-chain amino acid transport system substrate-binding protein